MAARDGEYVRQTLKGDREAYGALIDSYKGMVFAVALNITGNYADSEDVVQEAFLHAYQKLSTLSDPAKFASWLCTIAKRIAFHLLHDRQKLSLVSPQEAAIENLEAPEGSPADIYARAELSRILWKEVADLPPKLREVILLYYVREFSVKAAADFLAISQRATKWRLKQARESLRDTMMQHVEGELRRREPSSKMSAAILASLPAIKAPLVITTSASSAALKIPLIVAVAKAKAAIITAVALLLIAGTAILVSRAVRPPQPPGPSPAPAPLAQKNKKQDQEKPKLEQSAAQENDQSQPLTDADMPPGILAKQTPVWGATVPLVAGSDQEYRFVLDGFPLADSLNKTPLSASKQNLLSIPLKPGQTSPRLLSSKRGQFLHEGPISMRLLFLSDWRDNWWGTDEFQPLNDAAKKNLQEVKMDKSLSSLRGVVIDSSRRPIARARVRATLGYGLLAIVECDSAGRFLINRLPQKEANLVAHAWGYQDSKAQKAQVLRDEKAPPLELTLQSAAVIAGTVSVDTGKPVVGAKVRARSQGGSFTALTDASGRYVLANLAPGECNLSAKHPNYAPTIKRGIMATAGQKPTRVDIMLTPGGGLSGKVVQGTVQGDLPVPNAKIVILGGIPDASGNMPQEANVGLEAISREDGSFVVSHAPFGQKYFIAQAKANGREQTANIDISLEKDSQPEPIIIRYPAETHLAGRVVDPDQKPVAGASICLAETVSAGNVRSFIYDPDKAKSRKANTDQDGKFSVEGIPMGGKARLRAEAAGFALTETNDISTDSREAVLIVMKTGGTISGHVVMADGKTPLKSAKVQAWQSSYRGPNRSYAPHSETQSREDGSFELPNLPEGTWHVGGECTENQDTLVIEPKLDMQVLNNQRTDNVVLVAYPSLKIFGKVLVKGTNKPVPVASIDIERKNEDGTPIHFYHEVLGLQWRGVTNAQGEFSSVLLAPGRYSISAEKEGLAQAGIQEVTVTSGTREANVGIFLFEGGTISGVVLNSFDQPASRTQIGTEIIEDIKGDYSINGIVSRGITDDLGRFSITGMPLHRQMVRVIASPSDMKRAESELIRLTTDNPTTNVIIRLQPTAKISGTVKDQKGDPIAGAKVTATASRFDRGTQRIDNQSALTGTDGAYEIQNLVQFQGTVNAQKDGFGKKIQQVNSWSGKFSQEINFVLESGKSLTGVLADLKGARLSDWRITARAPRSDALRAGHFNFGETRSDSDGAFHIDNLPSKGDFYLQFSNEPERGYDNQMPRFSFRTGVFTPPDNEQVFILPHGGTIKGRVLQQGTQEPFPTAKIVVSSMQEVPSEPRGIQCVLENATTNNPQPLGVDGRFDFHDFPLGKYQLMFIFGESGSRTFDNVLLDPSLLKDLGDITLSSSTCVVTGRFVDAATGRPYTPDPDSPNAKKDLIQSSILFRDATGGKAYARADIKRATGRFKIAGLPTNTSYILPIIFRSLPTKVLIPPLSPDNPTDIGDIKMHDAQPVLLKLTGPNGEPAIDAPIRIYFQFEGEEMLMGGQTNNDGEHIIKNGIPGPVTLTAHATREKNPWIDANPGFVHIENQKFIVTPGAKSTIEVRFPTQTKPTPK